MKKEFVLLFLFTFTLLLFLPNMAIGFSSKTTEDLIQLEQKIQKERQNEIIVKYKNNNIQERKLSQNILCNIKDRVNVCSNIEVLRLNDNTNIKFLINEIKKNSSVDTAKVNSIYHLQNIMPYDKSNQSTNQDISRLLVDNNIFR